jgi:hypothetical protein
LLPSSHALATMSYSDFSFEAPDELLSSNSLPSGNNNSNTLVSGTTARAFSSDSAHLVASTPSGDQ